MRVSVDEFRAQVIADRGGLDNLSAVEQGFVRRLAELETVARLLASDLAARGVLTAKGRVRGVYVQWLATLDRWAKYAERVGLERRAKPVPTIAEYLDARARESEDRP
jgi:hypothetical protein